MKKSIFSDNNVYWIFENRSRSAFKIKETVELTMSLIAGYVHKKQRLPEEFINEKVKSFSSITNDDLNSYDMHIFPTKFGHVITRCKPDLPIKCKSLQDSSGNLLVYMGFFCDSDPENYFNLLLKRCCEKSPQIIETCEGEFIAAFVESDTGRTHIINDRFASKPCYVLKTENCLYFSSSLTFLLHFTPDKNSIDIGGLLQMFSFDHTLGEKTIYSDVQRVTPASHIVLGPGEFQKSAYWTVEYLPDASLDPTEYSTDVFNCFKQGVEHRARLAGKGVLALSGGLDSRLIAYCLPDKNNYYAFTFVDSVQTEDTAEVNTAKEVSRLLGLNHRVKFIPVSQTSSMSKDLIYLTGGLRSLTHVVKTMSYVEFIRYIGCNYLLGGGPGDVIAGSKIPKSLVCISPDNVAAGINIFFSHYTPMHDMPAYLKTVFRRDLIEEFYPATVNSFFHSFEGLKAATAAHKITAWALLNRWPAFTFTTPLHDHPDIFETFCHLDYKFCELMLRLPAEWLYAKNFYNFMIYRNLVELKNVANANTGKTVSGEMINYRWIPPSKTTLYKEVLKSGIKKAHVGTKLLSLFQKPRNSLISAGNFKHVGPGFLYSIFKEDKRLFLDLGEIFHSIPELKYVLDIQNSEKFLEMFRNGEPVTGSFDRDTDLLGKLAAFCYSFKYLVYQKP